MAVINGFNNDSEYERLLERRRRFEKYDDKPFGEKFPFKIERKPTDSDEFFKGLCQGAKAVYEMWRAGLFEDSSCPVTYFSKEDNWYAYGTRCLDDYEDDFEFFEEDAYEAGFDNGFKQGYQSASEDASADIYVDTEQICKIDQLQQEILELGRKLHPSDIDMLNSVLKRVIDLKYQVAKDAVDEYLGYR